MAIIKCKMCGGDMELSSDKTYGMCEFCGSSMTLPKIDDDQRAAAFNRGNHFRRIGEFDKALSVYERIVQEDNTDAEAHWCCALCRFGIEYVEDPATYEWLPTCHRASFDSFLEDVDYKAALEYSDGITRRQYQKDGAKIAEVQRGILATSQSTEPYDVFICYKESDEKGDRTRDSLMAQEIYYQLTEQGRKVFFARITLEDVAGTQYEPYIFAALNSAKVMIVVGTKPEYLNAVWVKNEWSRFLAMMKKDRNKLLLPCYRDMDPYDMPEQLSVLQSYDMGKIGFIQDLSRGIAKVLDTDKKQDIAKEPAWVQQSSAGISNAVTLLKRGRMALEDAEWARANDFFEEVLNIDAECAEAYLGKALADSRCVNLNDFVKSVLKANHHAVPHKHNIDVDENAINDAVTQFSIPFYLTPLEINKIFRNYDLSYESFVEWHCAQKEIVLQKWNENRNLARASQFAGEIIQQQLDKAKTSIVAELDERIQKAVECCEATKKEKEATYQQHVQKIISEKYPIAYDARHNLYLKLCATKLDPTDRHSLTLAKADFNKLGNYLDCVERMEKVSKMLQELDEMQEREEQQRKQRQEIERQRYAWRQEDLCQHCGGELKGLFTKKCVSCGKPKDY